MTPGPSASSSDNAFELAPLDVLTLNEQMKLISDSFDKPVDADWYRWKHLDCPWGPSRGIVAIDRQGPAAMFLCLPWQVDIGRVLTLTRGVDSGTLPRAQRRGLFQAMVQKWATDSRSNGDPLTFDTANEPSARVHGRAGATILRFRHGYAIPFLSSSWLRRFVAVPISEAVQEYAPAQKAGPTTIRTSWDAASLAWRFDQRSGLEYKAALLPGSVTPTGLIYRLEKRQRVPILVRSLAWGDQLQQSRLSAAVARSHMAPLVLDLSSRLNARHYARGNSLLCTWDNRTSPSLRPTEPNQWDLHLCDLEGVI